ncbi:MAG: recombinase family protein, partial [Propionicimonas sp.]|nr:recombinase family protein [Propionicimonas sp.]
RNGLEEGLSIPAQREAAQRKADQLGAVIVKEFIEPGESAKTAQRRALQDMLDYVTENPVQYCIINKVDRLARNRLDDAIIHATLRDANISLVSVTENIDETPSGMLMHGILASMAEFYSLNLAQEVLKGMTQKASMGGTPAKAPLGYLNVRTTDAKGHEIRNVTVDPERADLITFAFTAYATGDWTLSSLAAELEARGLTTRPTPSFPSKPVTTKALHKILINPYYQGSVTFRGVTYDGAHAPLVDTETWLRVQTELAAKNQRGEKPRTHDHYLKGTLYCSCGAKMMIECPTGKSGITYEYFTCSGRRKKNGCTRSAILTDRIEDRIDSTYGTNGLTPDEADRVREVLGAVFDQLEATTDDERALLTTQKEKLDAERLKLVQAHYADAIPLDLLKSEQERIRTTLDAIERRREKLATSYEDAREGLDQLADILTDLGDVYARCEPAERRILNRALFDRIILDDEETVRYQPDKAVQVALDCVTPGHTPIAEAEASDPEDTSNPARWSAGQGSKISLLVEAMERCGNRRPRVQKLVSAWNQGIRCTTNSEGEADDALIGAAVEPSKRPRTRLTDKEVDAMRTARAQGISVNAVAKQFGVHRGTVWAKTKLPL